MSKEVKRYNGLLDNLEHDCFYVRADDYDALAEENQRNERIQVAMALDIAAVGEALGIPGEDQEGGTGEFIDAIEALFAERDRMKDTLEHIRDTIDAQMAIISDRAPGKYLDKMPVVRSLRMHRNHADEALQGEQP